VKKLSLSFCTGTTGKTVGATKFDGCCIKPIAVASVFEIVRETDVPVIGCGGISKGEDAIEFLMAGASAVQIGVGVADRGVSVFNKVSREIEEFMKKHDYRKINELIGVAQE